MSDILVIGTASGAILNPDGSDSFAVSAENGLTAPGGGLVHIITKGFTPQGMAGDAVWRRVHLTVEHTAGITLAVNPVLDGNEITENSRYFNRARPNNSNRERYTFMIPLGLHDPTHGRTSTGLRGTTMQLKIAAFNPEGDWFIESVDFMYASGSRSRRN
jgi:hypothetical protein